MKDGAFISYRRDRGSHLARLLKYALESPGLDVFLDVDDLGAGHFDENLVQEIERCEHFIVVLTAGSLDRCHDDGDYFRREIETAIASKRRIVPVVADGFRWPDVTLMPEAIRELSRHNDIEYSHRQWDAVLQKVRERVRTTSRPFRVAIETSRERFDACMSVLLPYMMVANGGTLEGVEFRRLQPRVAAESEYDGLLESMYAARLVLFDLDTASHQAFQFRLGVAAALSMPVGLALFDSDLEPRDLSVDHLRRVPWFNFVSESRIGAQHPREPCHLLESLREALEQYQPRPQGRGLQEEREWLLRTLGSDPEIPVNLTHAFELAHTNFIRTSNRLLDLQTCLCVFVQLAGRLAPNGSAVAVAGCAERLFECVKLLSERGVSESGYSIARNLVDHYAAMLRDLAASRAVVALDEWATALDRSLTRHPG